MGGSGNLGRMAANPEAYPWGWCYALACRAGAEGPPRLLSEITVTNVVRARLSSGFASTQRERAPLCCCMHHPWMRERKRALSKILCGVDEGFRSEAPV